MAPKLKTARATAKPEVKTAKPEMKSAKADAKSAKPFWETKKLGAMSAAEWESLCDGCGRCCLNKLEDEDTGDIHLTRLACALLDIGACRCSDYDNRFKKMADCIQLTPANIETIEWLPSSCGYRRVKEGRGLAWWHPLISGDPETVHQAGISVRTFARSEKRVRLASYHKYIIVELGEEVLPEAGE